MAASGLRVDLLGPLTAARGCAGVIPAGTRARRLLALLALRGGQPVPSSVLLEEVLDGEPPTARGQRQLHRCVAQVRQQLAAAGLPADEVLASAYRGYRLVLGPGGCDVPAFEQLAARGERALEEARPAEASQLLHAALELWRGPFLAGLPCGPLLSCTRSYLEEHRMTTLEKRIDADLMLGRHQGLADELADLAVRYPGNERLCGQYRQVLARAAAPARGAGGRGSRGHLRLVT